jgi:phosphatidylglycerophosphate synthase
MVFLQWFSDSYDGALGRLRDTGIPKWGYYMDHLLDYVFLASVFIGYSFLVGEGQMRALFVMLILFTAFMMNSYLSFAATSEFKISFLGFGPTEGRILFILFNAYLILFGLGAVEKVLVFVIPAVLLGLSVVIFRTQRYIWHVDMAEKRERLEGGGRSGGEPASRQRHVWLPWPGSRTLGGVRSPSSGCLSRKGSGGRGGGALRDHLQVLQVSRYPSSADLTVLVRNA